jgi:hypothetical protein
MTGELVPHLNKLCVNLKYLNLSQCKHVKCSAIQLLFEHPRLESLNLSFIDDMTDEALEPSDPEIFVSTRSYPIDEEGYIYDDAEDYTDSSVDAVEAASGGGSGAYIEEVQWKVFEAPVAGRSVVINGDDDDSKKSLTSAASIHAATVSASVTASLPVVGPPVQRRRQKDEGEHVRETAAVLVAAADIEERDTRLRLVEPVHAAHTQSATAVSSGTNTFPSHRVASDVTGTAATTSTGTARGALQTVVVKQGVLRRRKSPLRTLILAKSKLTNDGLRKMTFLPSLVELGLPWCGDITDAGVCLLVSRCPNLRSIDLKSCNITDASVQAIAQSCKELRHLDVSWCPGVTDSGIKCLAPAFPSIALDTAIKAAKAITAAAVAAAVAVATATGTLLTSLPSSSLSDGDGLDDIPTHVLTHAQAVDHDPDDGDARSSRRTHIVDTYVYEEETWSSEDPNVDRGSVKLESLSLVWCSSLTDDSLAALATLPALSCVEASGCSGMSQAVANVLRNRRDPIQVNL